MLILHSIIVITSLSFTDGARILGIFPMAAVSHYTLYSKLMKGLAEAGHDVTMVSPYRLKELPKNGKYRDLVLEGFAAEYEDKLKSLNYFEFGEKSLIDRYLHFTLVMLPTTNRTLHNANIKKLVESNETFDALILEQMFNDNLKVYGYIFNCPVILLSPFGPNSWVNPTVGNPQPPSYVPQINQQDFSNDLSFFNRASNLYCFIVEYLMFKYYIFPQQERMMHAIYPDAPSLDDLYSNVSLVLLSSHSSIWSPVPLVPNMVEIGGFFIDPPKKLPPDLQEFMNKATEGVIYFSMGSNLRSKNIPLEKKQAFLNVFKKLKQKVIWKFEDENLPNKPRNVLIRKWCPQADILAHPNTKLFITHGGLLSTTEAIHYGIPLLAIPVFGDQPTNAAKAVMNGYALQLHYHDPNFNEETLDYMVKELLNNPVYMETAKEKSKIYHDRPMKPMEAAVFWVEYVIKHRGAPHLRVAGLRMPWYEYFMVDVLGCAALALVLIAYVLNVAIRRVFRQKSGQITVLKKIN